MNLPVKTYKCRIPGYTVPVRVIASSEERAINTVAITNGILFKDRNKVSVIY